MRRKGTKNKNHSPEYKISVILDMRENHLGYKETMRKYSLTGNSTLQLWERIFLEEGAQGLMEERRGRSPKGGGTKRGRPPKLNKSVEDDLISKCQRLEMENEYLKKLIALVQSEEENEKSTKLK